jgi:glycosyltransferase involved in cell wall biosynthesis
MSKPRILIIENSTHVTGALKSCIRSSQSLSTSFDFYFIIPTGSLAKKFIRTSGFDKITELPLLEVSRRPMSLLLYIPRLLQNTIRVGRLVKRERIDLIDGNDFYNLLPALVRWRSGIPYLCYVRFLPDRFPRVLVNLWMAVHLRFASRIIAVSNAVEKMLPANSKIAVIYNELPVNEVYPPAIEARSRDGYHRFLYLSNYIKGKGQDYALDAFSHIHHLVPQWKIRFVGSTMGLSRNERFRQSLIEKGRSKNISEKIEWAGFTEDVELEYKNADIALNFSESESFSITCAEAMFYGLPLIATDCGGPSEIVDSGENGVLVENRNVQVMSRAMVELANDEQKRKDLGMSARVAVREKFSFEKTSRLIREIYDEILNNNEGS